VLICSLTLASAVLYLFYIFQMEPISSPLSIQEWINDHSYDSSFFFSIILLVLLLMIFVKRKKTFRVVIGSILGLSGYVCWFSTSDWWSAYNIGPYEQRLLAIVFLGIALWVLVSETSMEKRRHFPEAVRREVIYKQRGKCNKCKRKLVAYDMDLDHKNGDSSNNKLSNCQVLCVACHRRKHVE
jgi:hypothetical protein